VKSHQDLLRDLREDNDLKQSDVAELIGTTQQQYSKYETGEIDMPIRALLTLADRYNVSTDFLLGRTDIREGVSGVNRRIGGHTAGSLISDVLSLDESGRAFVLEAISLQKIKREYKRMSRSHS
jgi:transcriptional regulator with XRE-family HTH domain